MKLLLRATQADRKTMMSRIKKNIKAMINATKTKRKVTQISKHFERPTFNTVQAQQKTNISKEYQIATTVNTARNKPKNRHRQKG